MSHIVLAHPQLDDARIVVHVDAFDEHVARGWEPIGPISDRARDPLLCDDEQAAHDTEVAAAAAALLAPSTDPDLDFAEPGDADPTDPATPADDSQEK